jgi:hypothetical protein
VLITDGAGVAGAYGGRDADGAPVVHVPGVGAYRHRGARVEVVAEADTGDVEASFHSTALPLLLQAVSSREVFHASAVQEARGVVAFCGASEAGKTTIGIALARRGRTLWADDAVVFEADGRTVHTVSLPFQLSCEGPPAVAQAVPGDEAAICAVVVVEPGAESVSIDRLEPPDAMVALLPNVYRFRPATVERERQMVASYLELVAHVPVLRLRYAKDVSRFDELLDAIHDAVLT